MIEHGCRRRTRSWGGAVGRNAKRTCDTQLLLPSVRKALHTEGKRSAPCMIRGVCAAKRAPSWQDLRAVYPPTAICRAFRMHGAHILPKPAHFEYTTAICCRGAPSGSRAWQHIASKATPRLRKGQHARSRHTPPEPTRRMRRCPAAAVGAGHGPSRAWGNAVGCGRYRLQGQLRCKSTNEPVHSNIFPLRY